MELAKETVAGRRLDRYEATGGFDADAAGKADNRELSKGLLAREIADMYANVADKVVEGDNEGAAGMMETAGDYLGEGKTSTELLEEDEGGEDDARFKSSKGEYNTQWVGEFDMKGSKVKDRDVLLGEGGRDVTKEVMEAKAKEAQGEGGGEGEGGAD
jgi:hypothetical protein